MTADHEPAPRLADGPEADVQIDEELVRSLLSEQHPDLSRLPLEWAATGWDTESWRLGEDLVVRLPRRPWSSAMIRHEQRWLPELAPLLPLRISTPIRVGEPSERFPRPWSVSVWVHGDPGDRVPITKGRDSAIALANFLRALHVRAPSEVPRSPFRGVPLVDRVDSFEKSLADVSWRVDETAVRRLWEAAALAPMYDGPGVWLHGDLHAANVVVVSGALAGVIDFGDMCAGDPATDLAAAWTLLPAGDATHFFATYGQVDDATMRRAKGWAVLSGLSLVCIGQAWERNLPGGQPTWGAAGELTLRRVLAAD